MSLKSSPQCSFDKYFYYYSSVQSPESDVDFLNETYKELRHQKPQSLREDFCGTFAVSCEWAQLNPTYKAYGVDLDPEPIRYGKKFYLTQLSEEQQSRVHIVEANVLDKELPRVDIILAANFSYYIFKTRQKLRDYFRNAYETLNDNGIFVVDCFGGSECQEPNEEETPHKGFSYFWDQDSYDPVTHHAVFHIHFKKKSEKKRKSFTYDWRMWSIPEIREVMEEAGFKRTYVYWEGTDKDGEGDGIFTRVEQGEDCEAWVAYVVGEA